MSHQPALFHDSIYDALGADVAAIGGIKKAASLVWPNHSDAASKLRSCLSIEHPQKLDPEELLALKTFARNVGSHATATFEAQQLGYQIVWIKPEDAYAEAQRKFVEAVDRLEQMGKRLRP